MKLRLHVLNQPDGLGCDMTYGYLDAAGAAEIASVYGCRLTDDVYLVGDPVRVWDAYRQIRWAVAGLGHWP
jgi:hypothetical protein